MVLILFISLISCADSGPASRANVFQAINEHPDKVPEPLVRNNGLYCKQQSCNWVLLKIIETSRLTPAKKLELSHGVMKYIPNKQELIKDIFEAVFEQYCKDDSHLPLVKYYIKELNPKFTLRHLLTWSTKFRHPS